MLVLKMSFNIYKMDSSLKFATPMDEFTAGLCGMAWAKLHH